MFLSQSDSVSQEPVRGVVAVACKPLRTAQLALWHLLFCSTGHTSGSSALYHSGAKSRIGWKRWREVCTHINIIEMRSEEKTHFEAITRKCSTSKAHTQQRLKAHFGVLLPTSQWSTW